MDLTNDRTAAPARSRLSPAALASVVVGGVLSLTWGVGSIAMLVMGLSALPALGSGLLLLVPWLLLMQVAVRVERRRAVAVHGIGVNLPARRRSHRSGVADGCRTAGTSSAPARSGAGCSTITSR